MLNQWILKRSGNFPVQKFKLSFAYNNYGHIKRYVDSWLRFVIGAKAVEIELDLGGGYFGYYVPNKLGICENECSGDEGMKEEDGVVEMKEEDDDEEMNDDDEETYDSYVFNYSDLVNSSVTVLKLRFCDLPCDLPRGALPIKIYSLREMHLDELRVWKYELQYLVASCVNLEILSIKSLDIWGNWKLESQSLKHFKFQGFDPFDVSQNSVEICAPKLESLSLFDSYDGEYFLKDTSSLVAVDVVFPDRNFRDYACWTNTLTSLGGVERLTFQNMWSWCLFDPAYEICYETFVFHNLKHVELFTAFRNCDILGLELLLQKCPQLETMALVHKYPTFGDVTDMLVVLEIPHLRLVEMKDFQNTEDELFAVGHLKERGAAISSFCPTF